MNAAEKRDFLKRLAPQRPTSQRRRTSVKFNRHSIPVKLLVPLDAPKVYTKAGNLAKRQPDPFLPGDRAYARLAFDGYINIFPFEMAGSGYELVVDAEEGVHYEIDIAAYLDPPRDPLAAMAEAKRYR